jgi:hypothetical protein
MVYPMHESARLDLRVMLVADGQFWFAQGMDVDYAAQGSTMEEARANFVHGLQLTAREHMRWRHNLDKLLEPAPRRAWREFYTMRHTVDVACDLSESLGTFVRAVFIRCDADAAPRGVG